MLTKQDLVNLMITQPEKIGHYSFRVGKRVVFTVSREYVEWSANRRLRWPVKKQISHTSFLMPAEVPAVAEPESQGYRFEAVLEEIAEKSIAHTMRGFWQKRVAEAFGLDPNLITLTGYKVVAVRDGRYLSLYDGVTEYKLGERLEQAAKSNHQGGFYVFENPCDCGEGNIPLPGEAILRRWPHRAILKVEYGGNLVRYKHKVAASWIRPLYVVRTFYC
jgi:hypothetical protein